jgi:hypothetical protein
MREEFLAMVTNDRRNWQRSFVLLRRPISATGNYLKRKEIKIVDDHECHYCCREIGRDREVFSAIEAHLSDLRFVLSLTHVRRDIHGDEGDPVLLCNECFRHTLESVLIGLYQEEKEWYFPAHEEPRRHLKVVK